jgi:hypothetical protein
MTARLPTGAERRAPEPPVGFPIAGSDRRPDPMIQRWIEQELGAARRLFRELRLVVATKSRDRSG